jgi:hypothetical protein
VIIVNRPTQPLQDYVQAPVKINVSAFRPEPLPQFLASDDFPRPLKEQEKKTEGLFLDFDLCAATA